MRLAPTFTRKPSPRHEGTFVVISCELTAEPAPSFSWYRGKTPLQTDERTSFKIEPVSGAQNTYVLSLVIAEAGPQDSDTYLVEVINQHGKITGYANLHLQAAPSSANKVSTPIRVIRLNPASVPVTMCAAPAFYYFIKSQLNGMVLDVESSITSPGALVSMWEKNGTDAQIWYDDPATGTIRNKLNGFCMDIKGGRLVMNPYQVGKQDQLWERKGNEIVDRRDRKRVLDIADSNGGARAKVIKNLGNGAPNQSWTFELV